MNLTAIIAAAEAEDWPVALSHALEAWRATRDPRLASLVRIFSQKALAEFEAPTGSTRSRFQSVWCALADTNPSPVATGWLAAHLTRKVPPGEDPADHFDPDEAFEPLLTRVRYLQERTPDPRIADAAVDILHAGRHDGIDDPGMGAIYGPVMELLGGCPDPPLLDRLRGLAGTPRSRSFAVRAWLSRHLPRCVRALEEESSSRLPDPAFARLTPWLPSPVRPAAVDVDELLALVYAEPDNDEVRAVLADVWLQQDDPRGIFLAAQLRGETDDSRSLRALLRTHRVAWLGENLWATLQSVRFRRGFLDEAALRTPSAAPRMVWTAASQDARLSTLRTLRRGAGNLLLYRKFLFSEQARDLRRIEIPSSTYFQELEAGPLRPLEVLEFGRLPYHKDLRKAAQLGIFEGVHTFRVPGDLGREALVTKLRQSTWVDRLTHLEIVSDGWAHAPWLPEIASLLDALERRVVVRLCFPNMDLGFEPQGSHETRLELWLHRSRVPDGLELYERGVQRSLWPEATPAPFPQPPPVDLPHGVVQVRLGGKRVPGLADALRPRWGVPVIESDR